MINKITLITFLLFPILLFSQDTQNCILFVPNSFTANNDGFNDYWSVSLPDSCYTEYKCQIFNRFGDIVWESVDPTDKWLGGFKNSSHFVQNEIYQYFVIYKNTGQSKIKTGSISILR